jgi:hypothetical protein
MRRNLTTNVLNGANLTNLGAARLTVTTQTGFVRGTVTDANAAGDVQRLYPSSALVAPVVVPGQTYTWSAYGRTNAAVAQMRINGYFYAADGTTLLSSVAGVDTTVNSSTFTRFSATATAPAGAAYGYWTIGLAAGTKAIGDTVDFQNLLVEASSVVGDYFDGSTSAALGWTYAWSGTANASIATASSAATTVRTNLLTNPSFETISGGYDTSQLLSAAVSTEQKYVGTQSLKATMNTKTAGSDQFVGYFPTPTVGTSYTASAYVYVPSASPHIQMVAIGGVNLAGTTTTAKDTWQRVSVTVTATTTNAIYMVLRNVTASTSGQVFYLDALMMEQSASLGDYFDGSFNPAGDFSYAWTGTANASTSIQRGATLVGISGSSCVGYQSSEWKLVGSDSVRVTPTTTNTDSFVSPGGDLGALRLGMVAGTTYTVSGTIRLAAAQTGTPTGDARKIVVFTKIGAGAYVPVASTQAPNTAGTTRLSLTFTVPAGATEAFIRLYNGASAGNGDVWWDALLLEASPIVRDYFDGAIISADADLTNSWSGTAHASTSLMRGVGVTGVSYFNAAAIQSSGWASSGTKSVRVIPTVAAAASAGFFPVTTTIGQTYTVKAKIRLSGALAGTLDGSGRRVAVYNAGISAQLGVSTPATNTAGVTELTATWVATTTISNIIFYTGASAGNGDTWWDDFIVVAGTYTGDYFDGNSTTLRENAYTWTGTANDSTSVWTRREIQGATLISCNYQPRKEIVH